MATPKWTQGIGLAYQASAATAATTPLIYLPAESAAIMAATRLYKRRPSYRRAIDYHRANGFDLGFKASGITPDPKVAGVLLWLISGGDAFASSRHTITPANAGVYCTFFLDQNLGVNVTKRLQTCRLTKLKMVQAFNAYMAWELEGVACRYAADVAALTPSLPTGVDNEPLCWAHYQTGGYFKVGVNGTAPSADGTATGWGVEIAAAAFPALPNLGDPQPADMHVGPIDVTWDFSKEFTGAEAVSQYTAFLSGQDFGINFKAVVGANDFEFTVPAAKVLEAPPDGVGAKAETILATWKGEARSDGGSTAIYTGVVKDGTAALYNTL